MAVDDQGYIVVADSGNNRIQVFTADGVFVKAFGCWGSGDGEFKVNVKPDPITPQATNRVSFSNVSLLLLVLCVVTNETFSFYFLHLLYAKKKKINTGTGRHRCHVQRQHSLRRSGKPPDSSLLKKKIMQFEKEKKNVCFCVSC